MIDLYDFAVSEIANYSDKESYVSDMALSSVWGGTDAEIPASRLEWLSDIWDATHRDFKTIAADAGYSVRALARRYRIPIRTAEGWSSGNRTTSAWTLLLIQEALGLVKREPTE